MFGKLTQIAGLMMSGKLRQNTPEETTENIRSALAGLGTGEPFFLEIEPGPGCLPLNCHGNVATMIARHGGTARLGWIVYEGGGGEYLKLVHHAIWERPDGMLADPTPSDERRNLFVPDSVTPAGGQSRYIALAAGRKVDRIIRLCKDMDEMQRDAIERLRSLRDDARPVDFGRTGRNKPCPCDSGKKYKRCHGG